MSKYDFLYPMDIPEEDKSLFEKMRSNYQSEKERIFFEKMEYKEIYELAPANDLILSEHDNIDEIYLCREYDHEYAFGNKLGSGHTDSLSDALETNLKTLGALTYDCTLLDWLRMNNYEGMRYDNNFDLM